MIRQRALLLSNMGARLKRTGAMVTALTFLMQNFAWAVCSDGSAFPPGGFSAIAGINWSPHVFTGTLGSVSVPDISVNENNDPGLPLTLGGHDWVFDQGSSTCKVTDVGAANQPPAGWSIPPVNTTDCVILPVIKGGRVTNLGDLPQNSTALTPTCNPAILAPSPANTYLNQLGCSISHGVANTPSTATTFLFASGIKGGLFSIALTNVTSSVVGGEAGKIAGPQGYYSAIPEGQKLDHAAISQDGRFLFGASSRNNDTVYACLNPLGDPGDPKTAIDPNFVVAQTTSTLCMAIGTGGDNRVKGLAVGSDGQPYMAGINFLSNFANFPNCIGATNGSISILDAFLNKRQNGCGTAVPNVVLNTAPGGVAGALRIETQALVSHGQYLYHGIKGGLVIQAKLTVDPATGATVITQRSYGNSFANITGIGFSEGLQSMMVYADPTAVALTAQEVVTKLPVCEDF